jgi:hypothetical protein
MARKKLGQVYKSKDTTKSNYIKVDLQDKGAVTLKHGQYIQVESKAYQLASIARAVEAGKLSEEQGEQAAARANKMPDFVLGELILITE